MAFIFGIADELAPTGQALTLLSDATQDGIVPARDVAVDGALVYSCDPDSTAVSWLMRRRLPLVFVDQAPAPRIDSVNIDDRLGARAAAQHVVDLGHRQVAIVTSGYGGEFGVVSDPREAAVANTERQRLFGWLDALGPAGIEPTVVRQPHTDPTTPVTLRPEPSSAATTDPPRSFPFPTRSPAESFARSRTPACTCQTTFPLSASTTTPLPVGCDLLSLRCVRTSRPKAVPPWLRLSSRLAARKRSRPVAADTSCSPPKSSYERAQPHHLHSPAREFRSSGPGAEARQRHGVGNIFGSGSSHLTCGLSAWTVESGRDTRRDEE
jgi:hypothetical protein